MCHTKKTQKGNMMEQLSSQVVMHTKDLVYTRFHPLSNLSLKFCSDIEYDRGLRMKDRRKVLAINWQKKNSLQQAVCQKFVDHGVNLSCMCSHCITTAWIALEKYIRKMKKREGRQKMNCMQVVSIRINKCCLLTFT